jgi:hypothetical protein
MKRLEYIYALLIAALFGWAISSCDDSGIITFDEEERAGLAYDNGETVKTTFTIGLSAPDVSADADIDAQTRALDNANIDYAQPENGGRFKNIVVLLVDHQNRIYGIHCKEFDNASGMKEYNVVFSNIDVPAADVTNKENYKVYAFGNVCTEHFTAIKNQEDAINENIRTTNINSRMNIYSTQIYTHCINATISHDNNKYGNIYNNNTFARDIPQFNINFTPGTKYIVNNNAVTSTGMPENNSVTATVVKGNTQFNVALKRVCARIKITFRNFTGQYLDASGNSVDNNIYIDEFKTTTNIFARSTKYLYDGTETYSAESSFDLLQFLDCKVNNVTASDHVNNKIENGKDITVSFYVFAVNLSGGCKYNLKVDRGKSLGNRAGSLEDGNVYVMWSDNLDKGSDYENRQNYCLGADDNNIKLIPMNNSDIIPYGNGEFGNRVFWHYTGRKFQSCKVNLNNDICNLTGKYINSRSPAWGEVTSKTYPTTLTSANNAQTFTETSEEFSGITRKRLKYANGLIGDYYLQISNDRLYSRYITVLSGGSASYPWVFFAKYIIKPNQTLRDNKGTITQIERNHSYELEFSVMPNEDNKRELLVNCVRRQNEVDWSETQK